ADRVIARPPEAGAMQADDQPGIGIDRAHPIDAPLVGIELLHIAREVAKSGRLAGVIDDWLGLVAASRNRGKQRRARRNHRAAAWRSGHCPNAPRTGRPGASDRSGRSAAILHWLPCARS